jgi:putative FmdB family regulatory protein
LVYVYECALCAVQHEVVKSVEYIDSTELCPDCGAEMKRVMQSPAFKIHYIHQKAEWNPGLNAYVKNEQHKREILAKYKDEHGSELEEVGNEDPRKFIEPIEKKQEKEFNQMTEQLSKVH